jgi:hypothetical protein
MRLCCLGSYCFRSLHSLTSMQQRSFPDASLKKTRLESHLLLPAPLSPPLTASSAGVTRRGEARLPMYILIRVPVFSHSGVWGYAVDIQSIGVPEQRPLVNNGSPSHHVTTVVGVGGGEANAVSLNKLEVCGRSASTHFFSIWPWWLRAKSGDGEMPRSQGVLQTFS